MPPRRTDRSGNPTSSSPPVVFDHDKKFLCSICQRQFNRKEHLQRHQNIHYGRKPHHCSVCDYSCRRRDLLSRHMKLAHKQHPNSGNKSPELQTPRTESNIHDATEYTASPTNLAQDLAGYNPTSTQGTIYQSLNDSTLVPPSPAVDTSSFPIYAPVGGNSPSMPPPSAIQPFNFNFLDGVCLPVFDGQPAFFPELPLDELSPFSPAAPIPSRPTEQERIEPSGVAGQLSRLGSPHVEDSRPVQTSSIFPKVSQQDWEYVCDKLSQFHSVLPEGYTLPSRHAITRYLHRFMNGFHPHFPILHLQTLSIKAMAPELLLAMAAVGSQYCLESHQGLNLFSYAHKIALEQVHRRDSANPLDGPNTAQPKEQLEQLDYARVEIMQALFYLMAMATWSGTNRALVRQAVATQSLLAMLVRQHGLSEHTRHVSSWEEWAKEESARRTKLIIFSFFNLHSLSMNLPSPILIADVALSLPCSESEWKAVDAESWQVARQKCESAPLFQDYFNCLFRTDAIVAPCSSLGSHVLIHALLQRIFTLRQASLLHIPGSDVSLEPLFSIQRALKKWQKGWEQNPESSLSPLGNHGPIAFNSAALYRLAYIRLVVDIGPARSLLEQDDVQIVHRLKDLPPLTRSPLLTLAARHALAALCPPVQMGINFIGQGHSWSVMHAVCSLEYAYILSQFLDATTMQDLEYPLDLDEQSIVTAAKETLREVEASWPQGDPALIDAPSALLGAKVVRAWATILENVRIWSAVSLITKTLFRYARYLETNEV